MSVTPYLVLKRGHRRRYCFTFMNDDATLSGDIQVGPKVIDRREADGMVLQKIFEFAGVFDLWMEKSVAGEHQDARALLRHTIKKDFL